VVQTGKPQKENIVEKIVWLITTTAASLVLIIMAALPLHAASLSPIEQACQDFQGHGDATCQKHLAAMHGKDQGLVGAVLGQEVITFMTLAERLQGRMAQGKPLSGEDLGLLNR
jgi:hypothetical protein